MGGIGSALGAIGGGALGYALAPATGGLSLAIPAAGALLGSSVGNELMPSSSQNQISDLISSASGMGQAYWAETDPLRRSVIDRLSKFMSGNFDPTASPMYAPMKQAVEQQYGTAKNNIMSSLPGGGTLLDSLADLETNKAKSLTDMISQIVSDEYSKAYGLASGSPQTSMAGLSAALGGGNALTGMAGSNNSLISSLVGSGASMYNASQGNDLATILALLK